MKYVCEIVIDKPRHEVVKLFDNANNLKYWQKGLVSFEHMSGEAGKPGAESILKYDFGKRKMDLIESISFSQFPDEFHATYTMKGVVNFQKNYFREENGQTRWISDIEFRFSGFMRIMAFFMGSSSFKKQSMSFMEDFKAFAEGNPKYGV